MFSFEQRLHLANKVHYDYVGVMWKKFGLLYHPGYSKISIEKILTSEGFVHNPPEILLSDYLDTEEKIKNETCHGSGHFLHPYGRCVDEVRGRMKGSDYLLAEIVVELGVMVYMDCISSFDDALAYATYLGGSSYSTMLAQDLFLGDRDLLESLSNCSMREAIPLMMPHLRRDFNIRRSPYDEVAIN